MISDDKDAEKRKMLEKAGYRFVGSHKHSAVKTCEWLRKSLRGQGHCYKQKFYNDLGIKSHQCLQISPAVQFCSHCCLFCWRNIDWTYPKWKGEIDEPGEIINQAIEEQRKLVSGFKGYENVDMEKWKEAQNPRHVAISLSGEPTIYPKISDFIEETKRRKMTSFLVTNGTNPKVIENMMLPTQLYVTLPAPNEETYKKTCNPLIKEEWSKINETLQLFPSLSTRKVIRLTLVRNLNMKNPGEYARLIEKANPNFVEVKAFMSVGFSRRRLPYESMSLHDEIKKFALQISDEIDYSIKDEKKDSRVVLLSKTGKEQD